MLSAMQMYVRKDMVNVTMIAECNEFRIWTNGVVKKVCEEQSMQCIFKWS